MSATNPKFTKHDVIAIHKAHPDWTCGRIAGHLGCMPEYVSATMRRNGLKLPNSGKPRFVAQRARTALLKANPHLMLPPLPASDKPHGVPPPTPCGTPNPAGEP